MFLEADLPQHGEPFAPDHKAHLDLENPDRKIPTFDKGGEKKPPTSQELTLSYLCENPHRLQVGAAEKEEQHVAPGKNLLDALGSSSRLAKKAGKDPNKLKRAPSAFFVFLEEFRKQFKEKSPEHKSVAAVGKAAGEKWKAMSDAS